MLLGMNFHSITQPVNVGCGVCFFFLLLSLSAYLTQLAHLLNSIFTLHVPPSGDGQLVDPAAGIVRVQELMMK